MIERLIVIGFITSTEFIQRMKGKWSISLFESATTKRLVSWCTEYYNKYNKAPSEDIEAIFYAKVKQGLPKEIAEEIEEDILPELSEQYEEEGINLDYLVDEAKNYFTERHLAKYSQEIEGLIAQGKIIEALKIASNFKMLSIDSEEWVDLSDESILDEIDRAFDKTNESLIKFKGALGEFWNDQLVREAFVALEAPDKRGKTFWLLEFAMVACRQKRKVAFFQAGDMSKASQLKRICVYSAKKSDKVKFSGRMYEPILDCVHNQTDTCDKKERICNFGIFEKKDPNSLRKEVTLEQLTEAYKENSDYIPCTECSEFNNRKWGIPYVQEIDVGDPLTKEEAKKVIEDVFIKFKRQFRLSTHANKTLTIKEVNDILDIWAKEGFIPDIIITDYADLFLDDTTKDTREQINNIWQGHRALSQKRHALVITVTHTKATGYSTDIIGMGDFSEDRRKHAHVTAMYGLNQDHKGREKRIGIMRINEIVVREGEFDNLQEVNVLMNLRRGRPNIDSYW